MTLQNNEEMERPFIPSGLDLTDTVRKDNTTAEIPTD